MSRNKLMILNTVVAFVTTIMCAIMGMIEIRLLLQKYGEDINGLMQTGNQALNYLTLLESGICAAFMYKMYIAIADKDNNKLSALYNGFRKGMAGIVIKMLVVAICVSVIYPLFLLEEKLSYLQMFSIFVLLSLKTILPYKLSMVPKYMIVLKEQKYKAELISGFSRLLTYLGEIILLLYTDWDIQMLLMVCIFIAILTGVWFQLTMNKLYENILNKNVIPDVSPRNYSTSLVVHNISNLVFNSTDNVISSIWGSLKDVTIYSSYNMIVGQVNELAHKVISGASAGMGIKIASREENTYYVYRELMTGSLAVAGIVTSVFLVVINDFIELWVGNAYCVGNVEKTMFGIIIYCGIILPCLNEIRSATGLFKESVWYVILQTIVNLVITLILVPYYGITGALIGTVTARVFISVPCNYFIVETKIFPNEKTKWYEMFSGYVITAWSVYIIREIFEMLPIEIELVNCWKNFSIKTVISTILAITLVCAFYAITDINFRRLLGRMKSALFAANFTRKV